MPLPAGHGYQHRTLELPALRLPPSADFALVVCLVWVLRVFVGEVGWLGGVLIKVFSILMWGQ